MTKAFHFLLLAQCLLTGGPGRGQGLPDTLRHADWRLYWASEFDTPGDSTTLARQWQFAYPWGRNLGGAEGQYYTGQQVTVDTAGVLHLRARRRAQPRPYPAAGQVRQLDYESGMIFSRPVHDSMRLAGCGDRPGFTYGLFEIRCRMPGTPNTFPAFCLYGFPDEVDIFEAGGSDVLSNNVVLWNHEYWRLGPTDASSEFSQSFFYWTGPGHLTDDFHTLALSWLPQELVYYFDGVPIRRERRLLPLGCQVDIIANLAVFTWARAQAASMDIDYIRVYKPRLGLPQTPVSPTAPATTYFNGPRATDAVLGGARAEMRWRLHEPSRKVPRLVVQTNINPRNFFSLPLPTAGRWTAPLTAFNEADTPRHWVASPDSGRTSLHWTLDDLCGQPVRRGQQPPAWGWELAWPDLPPGAYSLHLRIGDRQQVRHVVYQLGRPFEQAFTPEWLIPAPAPRTPTN